jgi:hypothetical protein
MDPFLIISGLTTALAMLSSESGAPGSWHKKLPTTQKKIVFHVGTGQPPSDKPYHSYEGTGLSVSEHPEAWRMIARLGDDPTWQLTRLDRRPGCFVDMRKLSPAQVERLRRTAIEHGLLAPRTEYVVSYYDSELDDDCEMTVYSLEQAEEEADSMQCDVKKRRGFGPTALLMEMWSKRFKAQEPPDDFALTVVLEGIGSWDGVWWHDKLEPMKLSAPRGMMFQSKLSEWQATKI